VPATWHIQPRELWSRKFSDRRLRIGCWTGYLSGPVIDEVVGRISCESTPGYPLGVPSLKPGERITVENVAYLQERTADGARLHGAYDPGFRAVRVLIERPQAGGALLPPGAGRRGEQRLAVGGLERAGTRRTCRS
jgi:hypothetical protein